MRFRISVTPTFDRLVSAVNEQFAISDCDEAAGIGDQPEHVPSFARTLPCRSDKRTMTPKDEAEGEVARGGASLQRVMESQKLGKARTLISGGERGPVDCKPVPARGPLQACSGGEPKRAHRIAGYRKRWDWSARRMAHAQAQPCGAMGDDDVAVSARRDFDQRLRSGRERNRAFRVGGFEDHHIGRGLRRPERWVFARVCLRIGGENSSPNAGTGPPVL